MTRPRRASVWATLGGAFCLALALAVSSCGGAELVAFAVPSESLSKARIAYERAGIQAISSTSALVLISDFSKIVSVPVAEALGRVGPGDPRRTPLLDELAERFFLSGPEGAPWVLLYTDSDDAVAMAEALEAASLRWASSRPVRTERRERPSQAPLPKRYALLLASLWALWLLARRDREDDGLGPRKPVDARCEASWRAGLPFSATRRIRLSALWRSRRPFLRLLALGAASPFLAMVDPTGAMLFIVASGLYSLVDGQRLEGASRRARARALWPYLVAAVALGVYGVIVEPVALGFAAASIAVRALALRAYPRLMARSPTRVPPRFVPIAPRFSRRRGRRLYLEALVPLAALAVVGLGLGGTAFSARSRPTSGGAGLGLRLVDVGSSRGAAASVLREHVEFQEALTYGRLGEARLGATGYTPAVRFLDDNGTMSLDARTTESRIWQGDDPFQTILWILGHRITVADADAR